MAFDVKRTGNDEADKLVAQLAAVLESSGSTLELTDQNSNKVMGVFGLFVNCCNG